MNLRLLSPSRKFESRVLRSRARSPSIREKSPSWKGNRHLQDKSKLVAEQLYQPPPATLPETAFFRDKSHRSPSKSKKRSAVILNPYDNAENPKATPSNTSSTHHGRKHQHQHKRDKKSSKSKRSTHHARNPSVFKLESNSVVSNSSQLNPNQSNKSRPSHALDQAKIKEKDKKGEVEVAQVKSASFSIESPPQGEADQDRPLFSSLDIGADGAADNSFCVPLAVSSPLKKRSKNHPIKYNLTSNGRPDTRNPGGVCYYQNSALRKPQFVRRDSTLANNCEVNPPASRNGSETGSRASNVSVSEVSGSGSPGGSSRRGSVSHISGQPFQATNNTNYIPSSMQIKPPSLSPPPGIATTPRRVPVHARRIHSFPRKIPPPDSGTSILESRLSKIDASSHKNINGKQKPPSLHADSSRSRSRPKRDSEISSIFKSKQFSALPSTTSTRTKINDTTSKRLAKAHVQNEPSDYNYLVQRKIQAQQDRKLSSQLKFRFNRNRSKTVTINVLNNVPVKNSIQSQSQPSKLKLQQKPTILMEASRQASSRLQQLKVNVSKTTKRPEPQEPTLYTVKKEPSVSISKKGVPPQQQQHSAEGGGKKTKKQEQSPGQQSQPQLSPKPAAVVTTKPSNLPKMKKEPSVSQKQKHHPSPVAAKQTPTPDQPESPVPRARNKLPGPQIVKPPLQPTATHWPQQGPPQQKDKEKTKGKEAEKIKAEYELTVILEKPRALQEQESETALPPAEGPQEEQKPDTDPLPTDQGPGNPTQLQEQTPVKQESGSEEQKPTVLPATTKKEPGQVPERRPSKARPPALVAPQNKGNKSAIKLPSPSPPVQRAVAEVPLKPEVKPKLKFSSNSKINQMKNMKKKTENDNVERNSIKRDKKGHRWSFNINLKHKSKNSIPTLPKIGLKEKNKLQTGQQNAQKMEEKEGKQPSSKQQTSEQQENKNSSSRKEGHVDGTCVNQSNCLLGKSKRKSAKPPSVVQPKSEEPSPSVAATEASFLKAIEQLGSHKTFITATWDSSPLKSSAAEIPQLDPLSNITFPEEAIKSKSVNTKDASLDSHKQVASSRKGKNVNLGSPKSKHHNKIDGGQKEWPRTSPNNDDNGNKANDAQTFSIDNTNVSKNSTSRNKTGATFGEETEKPKAKPKQMASKMGEKNKNNVVSTPTETILFTASCSNKTPASLKVEGDAGKCDGKISRKERALSSAIVYDITGSRNTYAPTNDAQNNLSGTKVQQLPSQIISPESSAAQHHVVNREIDIKPGTSYLFKSKTSANANADEESDISIPDGAKETSKGDETLVPPRKSGTIDQKILDSYLNSKKMKKSKTRVNTSSALRKNPKLALSSGNSLLKTNQNHKTDFQETTELVISQAESLVAAASQILAKYQTSPMAAPKAPAPAPAPLTTPDPKAKQSEKLQEVKEDESKSVKGQSRTASTKSAPKPIPKSNTIKTNTSINEEFDKIRQNKLPIIWVFGYTQTTIAKNIEQVLETVETRHFFYILNLDTEISRWRTTPRVKKIMQMTTGTPTYPNSDPNSKNPNKEQSRKESKSTFKEAKSGDPKSKQQQPSTFQADLCVDGESDGEVDAEPKDFHGSVIFHVSQILKKAQQKLHSKSQHSTKAQPRRVRPQQPPEEETTNEKISLSLDDMCELIKLAMVSAQVLWNPSGFIIKNFPINIDEGDYFQIFFYPISVGIYFLNSEWSHDRSKSPEILLPRYFQRTSKYSEEDVERAADRFGAKTIKIFNVNELEEKNVKDIVKLVKHHLEGYGDSLRKTRFQKDKEERDRRRTQKQIAL